MRISDWSSDVCSSDLDNENADRAAQSTAVLTDDAYRLTSAADGKVNLVEFLDFECEVCLALYPTMERIRAENEDRITFRSEESRVGKEWVSTCRSRG